MLLAGLTLAAIVSPDLGAQNTASPSHDTSWRAGIHFDPAVVLDSTPRVHAIQHSDFYYTRLTIHKIGSYVMFPLEGAEYWLGNDLLNKSDPSRGVREMHGVVATAITVLFATNTATGGWNLWDSRHETAGRTRRYVHAGLLIASDAGFIWAGSEAHAAHQSISGARRHRDIAIGSIALSGIGTIMMWIWN
jgi:hypothetical protein